MSETPKSPRADRPILCQSCPANIGTTLAQVRRGKISANKKSSCQTTLAQQKPLILLGEMHFCANFQYIPLRGMENLFLIKNIVENFRTRPRVCAHTRNPIKRARARYSIRRNFKRRADGSRQRQHQPHRRSRA